MTARVVRPAISLVAVSAVIVAALAAYLFMTTSESRADSIFVPQFTNKTRNALIGTFPDPQLAGKALCADNTTLGAAQTTTANLTILDSHLNFSNVTTFAPNATTITPGTSLATSAKVGGLQSLTNLGLLNSECNNAITVDFIFYNVALPNNPGNPRASTNIAYPRAEGSRATATDAGSWLRAASTRRTTSRTTRRWTAVPTATRCRSSTTRATCSTCSTGLHPGWRGRPSEPDPSDRGLRRPDERRRQLGAALLRAVRWWRPGAPGRRSWWFHGRDGPAERVGPQRPDDHHCRSVEHHGLLLLAEHDDRAPWHDPGGWARSWPDSRDEPGRSRHVLLDAVRRRLSATWTRTAGRTHWTVARRTSALTLPTEETAVTPTQRA